MATPDRAGVFGATTRIGGFGATVALTTLVSLISLPAIVGAVGADRWAHLALIQSVTLFVGVVVTFGWAVSGPADIARSDRSRRASILASSIGVRALLFTIAWPSTTLVLTVLLHGDWVLALLGSATYLVPSLGANWYFVGRARPWRIFALDAIPAATGAIAGVVLITVTQDLSSYLGAQLTGYVLGALLTTWSAVRDCGGMRGMTRSMAIRTALRTQSHAASATIAMAAYAAIPIVVVQIWLPAQLPVYAFADRLFRYAAIAFGPIQLWLQGWVPAAGEAALAQRGRRALLVAAGAGVLGGAALAGLSSPVAVILSHGQIMIPLAISVPLGVAFIGVTVSATLGHVCLPPLRRTTSVARATLLGLVLCVVASVGAAAAGVLTGIAWAVAICELAVAAYELAAFRRGVRDVAPAPGE